MELTDLLANVSNITTAILPVELEFVFVQVIYNLQGVMFDIRGTDGKIFELFICDTHTC